MRETVAVGIIKEVDKKVAVDVKKTKAAEKALKTCKWLNEPKFRLLIIINYIFIKIINSNCKRIYFFSYYLFI